MKIYINRKPVSAPWGGGNKSLAAIISELNNTGHEVVHVLDPSIDVALCFDPRRGAESGLVDYRTLYDYVRSLASVKKIPIIQRVGDIGTHGKPELTSLVAQSVVQSDAVVYPSKWAHDVMYGLVDQKYVTSRWCVIENAPAEIFYTHGYMKQDVPSSIRFVTHHWSDNPLKGFEFYSKLDKWASFNNHEFTYIGRAPSDFNIRNKLAPKDDEQLAMMLPEYDVYVTASVLEAGANHCLEAVACGLPIIYHKDGGSVVDYCQAFGEEFDGTLASFEIALDGLRSRYSMTKQKISDYTLTIEQQAKKYVKLIEGHMK